MQSRHSLLDLFSTFLNLSDDRAQGWLTDGRLHRHMQQHLDQNASAAEDFWVVYWHRYWQQVGPEDRVRSRISEGHLSAYLQETCYWSVQRAMPKTGSGQVQLSDCFQVAIAQMPKLLRKFDSSQRPSLKAYAHRAFENFVRDHLRQRQEADCCSDWGLLIKVSRKRLSEALKQSGMAATDCDRVILAWSCFEELYLPTKVAGLRQTKSPDVETWQTIADAYDRQRTSLQPPAPAMAPAQLERDLLQAAKQVRTLLYPPLKSLNLPKGNDIPGEIQDDLPASEQDSLLSSLIQQEDLDERQQQQQQMQAFLITTIATLGRQAQELLTLYYGQRLKQQQIAQHLNIQQYTVSRQLSKAREILLLRLVQWANQTWHISADSNVVASISTLLEDWLQYHYELASADTTSLEGS
ncbi:MAG: sigma-70 family RNA polymerase sigma factor [Alkalinema sp. RU_4_3]|nr:sigma-70 family RNA polymerase sigma factor [Alkalinema sp. RU_4_3]